VVINKIDRENANPKKVLDLVFELFMSLNATDEQLDFPFIYCSAKQGYAKTELEHVTGTMEPLFDAIIKHIPPPRAKAGEGFQMLVANLDYSDYLGRIAFGKIYEGKVKVGDPAICRHGHGKITKGKITAIFHFEGMKRIEVQEAHAGDIVGLTGFEDVFIGETICDSELRPALPYIPIDPPTIQMEFAVNDSPLAGKDGKLVTARHIWERLVKEIRTNVALRISQTNDPKIFAVSGRGVMSHLFHEYGEDRGEIAARKNGSLVSMDSGEATSYALNMVQERGRLMVEPGDLVYVGMIVGENARENDIPVNPVKEKKLTNMRSQGDGKGIQLNA